MSPFYTAWRCHLYALASVFLYIEHKAENWMCNTGGDVASYLDT